MTHHEHQPRQGTGRERRPRRESGAGDRRTGNQHARGRGDSPGIADEMGGPRTGGRQQSGEPMTERMGGGQQGTRARSFDDHLTDELRILLEDFGELSHVAAWCATECAAGGPELGTCARICQDLAEIAALNEMLIARDSMFGPEIADTFCRVASEGLRELQRYQQRHPHVAETIATIERTMDACETVLQQVGRGTGGQQLTDRMGGRTGGQRTGGHMDERETAERRR